MTIKRAHFQSHKGWGKSTDGFAIAFHRKSRCLKGQEITNRPLSYTWWRHQMETFSALLALCAGNSPVSGEFPTQRPVTRSCDVLFDLRLNKRLSKQSWGWWFETPPCSFWCHRNDMSYHWTCLWVVQFNGLYRNHYLPSYRSHTIYRLQLTCEEKNN